MVWWADYGNPSRGTIQQWTNRFAVASWREWMELNTIDMARNIRVPMAIIYGDQTFLQDNITAFYNLFPGQKTIADYCQHISVPRPRHDEFLARHFETDMPTVRHEVEPFQHEF